MRLDITFMPGESGMDKNKRICCFCERWESGGIESFLFNVLTRMDLQHLVVVPSSVTKLGAGVFLLNSSKKTEYILLNCLAVKEIS